MAFIQMEQYTKIIRKRVVLDQINLQLKQGKIYGFVGINGCGKTMLLRAICGFITPTEGSAFVDGVRVGKGVYAPSLGAVIENTALFDHLTAFENLSVLNTFSKNKISDETIRYWIERFGLQPDDKRKYGEFSLGMCQRLSLAQAFMHEPALLVLDEPTNALDEGGVQTFHQIVLEAKAKGATVLMASHSKEDIETLCDSIFYLAEGKLVKKDA